MEYIVALNFLKDTLGLTGPQFTAIIHLSLYLSVDFNDKVDHWCLIDMMYM